MIKPSNTRAWEKTYIQIKWKLHRVSSMLSTSKTMPQELPQSGNGISLVEESCFCCISIKWILAQIWCLLNEFDKLLNEKWHAKLDFSKNFTHFA